MEYPITLPRSVQISSVDFDRLKAGFYPKDMEDRWECSANDPDQQGIMVVRLRRSWTSSEQIAIRVKSTCNRAEIVESTWDRGNGRIQVTETKAKTLATNICKNLLGCE